MAPTIRKSLCAAVLAFAVGTADATEQPSLEDAFWACDYIATTRGTAAAPGETCAAVYDELKAVKFGGDFEALLAWWQVNKEASHERIAGMTAIVESPPPVATVVPERVTRRSRLLAATRTYLAEIAAVLRED